MFSQCSVSVVYALFNIGQFILFVCVCCFVCMMSNKNEKEWNQDQVVHLIDL